MAHQLAGALTDIDRACSHITASIHAALEVETPIRAFHQFTLAIQAGLAELAHAGAADASGTLAMPLTQAQQIVGALGDDMAMADACVRKCLFLPKWLRPAPEHHELERPSTQYQAHLQAARLRLAADWTLLMMVISPGEQELRVAPAMRSGSVAYFKALNQLARDFRHRAQTPLGAALPGGECSAIAIMDCHDALAPEPLPDDEELAFVEACKEVTPAELPLQHRLSNALFEHLCSSVRSSAADVNALARSKPAKGRGAHVIHAPARMAFMTRAWRTSGGSSFNSPRKDPREAAVEKLVALLGFDQVACPARGEAFDIASGDLEPRTLAPCGHTVSVRALDVAARTRSGGARCPLCATETTGAPQAVSAALTYMLRSIQRHSRRYGVPILPAVDAARVSNLRPAPDSMRGSAGGSETRAQVLTCDLLCEGPAALTVPMHSVLVKVVPAPPPGPDGGHLQSWALRLHAALVQQRAVSLGNPNALAVLGVCWDIAREEGARALVLYEQYGASMATAGIVHGSAFDVAELFSQLARTLHVLHTHHGIAHGAVVAENVMFGEDGEPRLGDLATVRAMLTDGSVGLVKEAMLAPELAPGPSGVAEEPATIAGDMRSLGALLQAVMEVVAPAEGQEPEMTAQRILRRLADLMISTGAEAAVPCAREVRTRCLHLLRKRPAQDAGSEVALQAPSDPLTDTLAPMHDLKRDDCQLELILPEGPDTPALGDSDLSSLSTASGSPAHASEAKMSPSSVDPGLPSGATRAETGAVVSASTHSRSSEKLFVAMARDSDQQHGGSAENVMNDKTATLLSTREGDVSSGALDSDQRINGMLPLRRPTTRKPRMLSNPTYGEAPTSTAPDLAELASSILGSPAHSAFASTSAPSSPVPSYAGPRRCSGGTVCSRVHSSALGSSEGAGSAMMGDAMLPAPPEAAATSQLWSPLSDNPPGYGDLAALCASAATEAWAGTTQDLCGAVVATGAFDRGTEVNGHALCRSEGQPPEWRPLRRQVPRWALQSAALRLRNCTLRVAAGGGAGVSGAQLLLDGRAAGGLFLDGVTIQGSGLTVICRGEVTLDACTLSGCSIIADGGTRLDLRRTNVQDAMVGLFALGESTRSTIGAGCSFEACGTGICIRGGAHCTASHVEVAAARGVGVYVVDQGSRFDGEGCRVRGSGEGGLWALVYGHARLLACDFAGNRSCGLCVGMASARLAGCALRGTMPGIRPGDHHGCGLLATDLAAVEVVERCVLSGNRGDCVAAARGAEVLLEDSDVAAAAGANGVAIFHDNTTVTARRCTIEGCDENALAIGKRGTARLEGCQVTAAAGTRGQAGIFVQGAGSTVIAVDCAIAAGVWEVAAFATEGARLALDGCVVASSGVDGIGVRVDGTGSVGGIIGSCLRIAGGIGIAIGEGARGRIWGSRFLGRGCGVATWGRGTRCALQWCESVECEEGVSTVENARCELTLCELSAQSGCLRLRGQGARVTAVACSFARLGTGGAATVALGGATARLRSCAFAGSSGAAVRVDGQGTRLSAHGCQFASGPGDAVSATSAANGSVICCVYGADL